MAAIQPNTRKMEQWLKPGGQFGVQRFRNVPGFAKPAGVRGSKKAKSGTPVRSYTTRSGKKVRGYTRGTSQSQQQVRQHGLVWGGKLFRTRSEFSRSLAAHGTSWKTFQKRHRRAASGLTTSFSRTKRSR